MYFAFFFQEQVSFPLCTFLSLFGVTVHVVITSPSFPPAWHEIKPLRTHGKSYEQMEEHFTAIKVIGK